jgi:hypothetical protein
MSANRRVELALALLDQRDRIDLLCEEYGRTGDLTLQAAIRRAQSRHIELYDELDKLGYWRGLS